TYHGSVVERRTATAITMGNTWPTFAPRAPSTAHAKAAGSGAAIVTRMQRPESFLAAPSAPTGYRPAGEPVAFRLPDPQAPTRAIASTVVWAFVEGPRVLTVEAGAERGGTLPWKAGDTGTCEAQL